MPVFVFAVKLLYMVPAVAGRVVLRLWRLVWQRVLLARATGWQVTDAIVVSSFELDESSKRVRNLILNLFEGEDYGYPWRIRVPEMIDPYDDDDGDDKSKPWITGLRYSYEANGETCGGTYFLPEAYTNSGLACEAGRAWVGKQIVVRYNPDASTESVFLQSDGAPGRSRIPAGLATEPYLTDLSLK